MLFLYGICNSNQRDVQLDKVFSFKIIHSINCVTDYSDQEVKLKKIASVIYLLVLYL